MKIYRNPNKKIADKIYASMIAKGGYCPCRLVESEDKEADSTFICPSKLDEEIQMPHFKFVADTDIEIGQAEGFYVYEATQDRFGQTRMDEIVSYFSKDLIGARSGEITKEDLQYLNCLKSLTHLP